MIDMAKHNSLHFVAATNDAKRAMREWLTQLIDHRIYDA